jgi:hypothetical protein
MKRWRNPPAVLLLFWAWCEAAEEWRRLRSDAAEARCRAARRAYYEALERANNGASMHRAS